MSSTSAFHNPVRVVISQPMYFPWVGMLEQIRLADIFVFYNDVQMTRGFFNRVQVKTADGIRWLTVPIRGHRRGQQINKSLIDDRQDWRRVHLELLERACHATPYYGEMLKLVRQVFAARVTTIADLSRESMTVLAGYFGLTEGKRFINSESLGIHGGSSQRLCDIVLGLGGNVYITGHGARNYLDHDLFEQHNIRVEYMNYECAPYPQLHGAFTPYVTSLDLIANCGKAGRDKILSGTQPAREFVSTI